MNTELISKVENKYKVQRPNVEVGDTVEIDTIIRDGEKKRVQKFRGIIIAKKGKGVTQTITVRKISYGIGVEKILPIYSPNIAKITILKHASVRRSKLYYLRERIGKAATLLKAGKEVKDSENELKPEKEEKPEEAEVEEVAETTKE